ncbi:hypothetical protein [Pseudomonas amygdali]|nr:hypothetical protein [Pseudomonas amygdali]UNO25741.1 hypothetical protein MDO45_26260 [Pseudomonas amygdali pv. aesculi]WGQ00643.1 hypothetical protein QFG70_26450 [Pseudomonas amygdali pv. aesculi]
MSVTRVQKTFSELEYTGKKKQTRRDRFVSAYPLHKPHLAKNEDLF